MYSVQFPGVKNWASVLDEVTARQAEMLARSSVVFGDVALMPDAHLGKGATVGSVIATKGAIIPAAIGVDIGCGVIAVRTVLTKQDLEISGEGLGRLHGAIAKGVPSGVGRQQIEASHQAKRWIEQNPVPVPPNFKHRTGEEETLERAVKQLGTLGSGNHFLEVSLDEDDRVWVVVHSGSRGIGNQIAVHFINVARANMEDNGAALEDPDLAYLVEHSQDFDDYVKGMLWAQDYAMSNRRLMMVAALEALFKFAGGSGYELEINCHHNFTLKEEHFGEEVWLTRKGAISAKAGEWGVVPGSMATATYVVQGLGNLDSYTSSAHGAGRAYSRNKARKEFNVESLAELMGDRAWNDRSPKELLDEHPGAYKDIEQVMRDMEDLVKPVYKLTSVLNYKGV